MSLPHIAIASLGGTISMTPDEAAGGVTPTLTASQLAAAVPGLSDVAHVVAQTLFQLPSASISCENVLTALKWASDQVDMGATGVVITQGTDTIEETAYLMDLYWQRPEPLVVTGAMRPPRAAGADGPANLLGAVLTAASAQSRQRGVLVVMNDVIHAARYVRKRHTTVVQAFESPETGPQGMLVEGAVRYFHGLVPRAPRLPEPPMDMQNVRVAIVQTWIGDDGELADLVQRAGYDGLVIAGLGGGHVPFAFAERFEVLCRAMPVVVATRAGAGPALSATYGYVGSEVDLARRGALMSGWLTPSKARTLLWAMLASGTSREALPDSWAQYVGP